MTRTLTAGQYFGTRSLAWRNDDFAATLLRGTVPPEQVSEHSHAGAHIVLAIDQDYLTAASAAPVGPMALIYNPPGTLHRDRFATTGGRFMSVDIKAGLVPAGVIDPVLVQNPRARAAAARIVGRIGAGEADDLELEDLLLALLTGIADRGATSPHPPAWLVDATAAVADLATDSAVRVGGIAQAVGVHPVHLARTWRQHFGCTPGEALRRHRMARAAGLLARGAGLADVALAAGFADQSHMTRAFRRDYGITPARFRDAFN